MPVRLKSGETILFIGNSITDCGRTAQDGPLGIGYVKQFADLLAVREPAKRVHIVNKGIGGNTVVDLRNRWSDDVLRHRPDWLSVKIGINDVHQTLAGTSLAVGPERFEETYDEILSRTVKKLPHCRILLFDPFYISTDRSPHSARSQVLELLLAYINTVHRMAKKYRTRLVKTHQVFQRLLKYHEPDRFCPEPVHPNPTGHFVIAEAVHDALSR